MSNFPRRNPLSFQLNVDKFGSASEGEKRSTNLMRPNSTFFMDGVRRFVKNPVAMVAFIFIVILLLAIIILPFVWPYGYSEVLGFKYLGYNDPQFANLSPFQYAPYEQQLRDSGQFVFPHIFGTDSQQHDYFICVIVGARTSLIVGVLAALIVLVIGGTIGALCGFKGGKFDLVVMRIVDVIYSLPDVLIIILLSAGLSAALGDNQVIYNIGGTAFIAIFIVFALLYWVGMCRLVRGQILTLRKSEYVMAAKATGASTGRIIRKHLIPNSMSVIIISAALQVPSAIFTESFLSYLGLGVQYPTPSLGSLAATAQNEITGSRIYLFLVPALLICFIVLSLNLLGDGLRDAFDPKLQK